MNFLEVIKRDLNNSEKRHGGRGLCSVNSNALRELLQHFERFESYERSMHDRHKDVFKNLLNDLTALYKELQDSELIMLAIMDILSPLIEERMKASAIDYKFGEYK